MSNLAFGAKPAVLRCSQCSELVDWPSARLQVVCGCRSHLDLPPVIVREATAGDKEQVAELFHRDFGHKQMVAYGELVSLDAAQSLVAETQGQMAGALAWRRFDGALHVLALATDPLWQRAGVGGHLIREAEQLAERQSLPRVIITITNDNIPALYFYQRHGYRMSAILRDSVASHSRNQTSVGFAGIPILDELQLTKYFA